MLSGLRVISREDAASSLEQKDKRVEKDAGKQKHRKHDRGKSKDKRSRKTSRKHATARKRSKTSDSSTDYSSSSSGSDVKKISRSRKRHFSKRRHFSDPSSSSRDSDNEEQSSLFGIKDVNDGDTSMESRDCSAAARKAAGLEWMVQAPPSLPKAETEVTPQDVLVEEAPEVNPKELNPFLKNGGDGYPDQSSRPQSRMDSKAPVVGDGGLSWRLKALKRAKEQAERKGLKLDEVVEERWGSLAEMTVSVSARRAAHSRAHLHAIRDRRRDKVKDESKEASGGKDKQVNGMDEEDAGDMARITDGSRNYLRDVNVRDGRMKAPRVSDSLSWKRRQSEMMRAEDRGVFHAAASALNKFENDGRFLQNFREVSGEGMAVEQEHVGSPFKDVTTGGHGDFEQPVKGQTEGMSANQLAAKALQLRFRGKTKEADEFLKLSQEKKRYEESSAPDENENKMRSRRPEQPTSHDLKSLMGDYRLGNRESGDAELVKNILNKKQYSKLTAVDEEYESIGDVGSKQSRSKKVHRASMSVTDKEAKQAIQAHKRISTQEERCQFCFGNPSRPKHLTISIATTCYLLLPPWEPLVEGHCLLSPMQHEGSTRNVDENVWEELRNYKKCLLKMFASQDKDVIFMETVTNLSQQRRHCLVECIPLPHHVAKQAPLYFKKAIDEAEDEWSQHNAKKLINTREKGLRGSIPKNFPYFHVEFGLSEGYVHVIDNEKDFKSDLGRNVVIGMLKLPEEGMHRRRKRLSYDEQKAAATDFRSSWDPYDWTKMLD